MKKVLMNASVASMIYKFNMRNIDLLESLGYQVDVACNFGKENPISEKEITDFRNILRQKKITTYETTCPRSIFAVSKMIKAYKQLKELADREQYDLVHTQSPIGGVICRLAFRKARKKGTKVIYQAHGFHFYKGAPIINWLIYYPIEKVCSFMTDILICINIEDFSLAQKKMKAKRIEYVPGVGIDLKNNDVAISKSELSIPEDSIILFSVGELNSNKNHETVIRALAKIDNDKVVYVIAGQGEKKEYLMRLASELNVQERVKLLGFRDDISDLMRSSDIFVFPSIREGLSVSLMEAMAAGLPCVVSKIRGNSDLINDNGGILFKPNSVDECRDALLTCLSADKNKMGLYNANVVKNFSATAVNEKMKVIYSHYYGD